MQFHVNSVFNAIFRSAAVATLTILASCGGSKSGNDNAKQYDEMDYALAAEYSALPAAVIIRVPLDVSGNEVADDASMRAYHGAGLVSVEADLASLFDHGTSPGNLISSLDSLNEEGTSTQSWGDWKNQPSQYPSQGPAQGKVVQAPYQTPVQGKVVQAPYQAPHQGPFQGKVVQAPFQGKVAQAPYQAPFQGKVVQAPYQAPFQGKVVQAPFQGKVAQTPLQGPMQGPMQKCCLAKHDKSKAFFDLFKSRKQTCGALGPLLHKKRCMAVPVQQIPVINGPVIGAPVMIEQPVVMEQPGIVSPGPAVLPSYNNTQFLNFQPQAFSNVNDNGYWGFGSAITTTRGYNRFYAYPRPACEGAEWCELVNN